MADEEMFPVTEKTSSPDQSKPYDVLSLKDIATWQLWSLTKPSNGDTAAPEPPIVARVPSLQRGPVWEPSQIEMLWDSILRGFPIGSLVVCRKLGGQRLQRSPAAPDGGAPEEKVTHHLLDGQQRGNAIAFGFSDPFDEKKRHTDNAILWLDLEPELPPGSTRNFLVRITTEGASLGL